MRVIDINAGNWHTIGEFYDAILAAIGAHPKHGRNINALLEGMVWGRTATLEPPYAIKIAGLKNAAPEVDTYVRDFQGYLAEARKEFQQSKGHDVDVTMEIVS